jgi:hypothetical protein
MKTAAVKSQEVESSYLAGVRSNLKSAGSVFITGGSPKVVEHDQGEKVRAAMVDRRMYDRDLYASMPHGRGFTILDRQRRWFFKRVKRVMAASVIAPPGPLLGSEGSPPPVTKAQLFEHLRGLMTDAKAPHLIGVCSPSGFEDDVWNAPPEFAHLKLVLIAPREDGGWRVSSADEKLDPRLSKLFDPEDVGQKIKRVRREVEERSADLLTGGLSAVDLAEDLSLPVPLVNTALAEIAKKDPELRVSRQSDGALLYRGAPVGPGEEDGSMSLAKWIMNLFSKEGEEAQKINVLAERRASLSSRINRMYEDIGKLEKKEEQLRGEGMATDSKVAKRRIAGQISRVRKDISRCNTSAALISKQINVISTHIHNLELAQTSSTAQLPTSEELTEAAVNAEEMLEQLNASDDLVSSLEVGMAESAISDDEAEILRELEGDAPESTAAKASEPSASRTDEPNKPEGQKSRRAQAE